MSERPRVGCGAAIVRDGRILLLRRVKAPEAGCWSLAGGKVDFGEPWRDAVVREVEEEVGIRLTETRLLCVVDLTADGQHWVSPVLLATAFEGEPRNVEPEKHSAMGWFALDALPSPLASAVVQAVAALKG
ncbi:CTP pyrophosphohydrolase [Alphaproteobacteria bacterium SO-S41]|nr:CTP pyrophosphohydrolase [Alphaproteobacteria bacterium SO-S41]